jgi:hypothetical protein
MTPPIIAAACRSSERNESCEPKIPMFIVNTSQDGPRDRERVQSD